MIARLVNKIKIIYGKLQSRPLPAKLPQIILGFAIAYYIIVMSWISILKQAIFATGTHDVGIYDQVIWLLSRFMPPLSTLGGLNLFGIHVSFNSVWLAPLFWLWDNINMLYIAQSVFLALPAIPLFLFAKEKLKSSWWALVVGLAYLTYPAVQNMNLENFHPEVIVIFPLTMAIYFMLKGNFRFYYPFLVVAMLGKEEVSVTVFVVGLYLLLFKREVRHGFITMLMAGFWYLMCFRVIMPLSFGMNLLSGSKPMVYSHWFEPFSRNLFNPAYYFSNIFHVETLHYLINLFAPVCFVAFVAPSILFMAMPALGLNILSGVGYLRSVLYHYNYITTVFIFFALIDGLVVVKNFKFKNGFEKKMILGLLVILLLLGGIIVNERVGRAPLSRHLPEIVGLTKTAQSKPVQRTKEALKMIPKDAKVSASYSLFPQLSHRKEIYMFPNPFKDAYWTPGIPRPYALDHVDYLVLEQGNHPGQEEQDIIQYLLASPYYEELYWQSSNLFMKKSDPVSLEGYGANYILYDVRRPLPKLANLSNLKIKERGKLACIFFAESGLELRNLLGENLPVSNPMVLQIYGYWFIPEAGQYHFIIHSNARTSLTINGKLVRGPVKLKQGFHSYVINYINQSNRYELKVWVRPSHGKRYIVLPQDLVLKNDPVLFGRRLREYLGQVNQKEKFNRQQKNKVSNGSFELAEGPGLKAWQIESWQADTERCSFVRTSSNSKRGSFSAMLKHDDLADARFTQVIVVEPNTYYKLSGWIKTEGVAHKGDGAYLLAAGTSMRTNVLFGANDWTYVEATGKTEPDQTEVKIQCRLGNYSAPNTGTAYFDEVSFKKEYHETAL